MKPREQPADRVVEALVTPPHKDLPGAAEPLLDFSFGYGLLLSIAVAAVAMAIVLVVLDRLIYRPLRRRGSGIVTFAIASLAVAISLRSVILMLWGVRGHC